MITKAEREKMILGDIGIEARTERKRRGWKQEDLSKRAAVGIDIIRRFEHGLSIGSAYMAAILVELDLTLEVKENEQ